MAHNKTPDYARLDDVDIYVQSTPMTPEERERLSAILKARREKRAGKAQTSIHSAVPPRTSAGARHISA